MRTGALVHVHETLFSAYVICVSPGSVNWNREVHVYDGILSPHATVSTSTCNVPPSLMFSDVEELLRNDPAADSQLIDGLTMSVALAA